MTGVTEAGRQTSEAIQRAAAESFAAHGYEATSLRQVAAAVGIKVGSLYNHISSKEELLLSVMGDTMDQLEAEVSSALDGVDDALARFVRFLDAHIRYHADHAQRVFIGNSELRSLPPELRQKIIEKRREYRNLIEELIDALAADGRADPVNPRLHAFSIVAMGTHVASWYRPDGGLELSEIVEDYIVITLRGLAVADPEQQISRALEPSAIEA